MATTKREGRTYSAIADEAARGALQELLSASEGHDTTKYQDAMHVLGELLGQSLLSRGALSQSKNILVVSTAEDADYLASGVMDSLSKVHKVRCAVFWNNHYSLPSNEKESIAPVVNSYYQDGYESSDALVIVKSVISGSCVVKTNLLRLMSINRKLLNNVHVASPVMHVDATEKLKAEFPASISEKFDFTYFAIDSEKSGGEVIPGIGGQVYELLGLEDQPAKTGYVPQLVTKQLFSDSVSV
ncbi:hypothetical protein GCM10027040_13100 [Halomonas shantousis]